MYLPPDLCDYLKLMTISRASGSDDRFAARVAVLGFCTTHYYSSVLKGIGKTTGFPLLIFETPYNTVEQSLLDLNSELHKFKADFFVFVTAVQGIRNRLMAADLANRYAAAEGEASRLACMVRRAAQMPGATVLIHELVVPYERAWGNLTSTIDGSLQDAVRRANDHIRSVARDLDNVYTIDCDHIASWVGKRLWFDERLWHTTKSFCHPEALPHLAGQAMDIFRAVKGKGLKCIALDLDNTLWGGVIGDDGLEGIVLGETGDGEAYVRFQVWLKDLASRGIILAVCSKNDEDKAKEPFRKHPGMVLEELDIACFVANWTNKADNLRLVASRLNIGIDSIVFLDDSLFERNLVRQHLPEVCVPEMPEEVAEYVPYLESLNLFEALQFSKEDGSRSQFYRANLLRDRELQNFTDVNDYLASLNMSASFCRFDAAHMPRISQLVLRTNQFNLTTIRHSVSELMRFSADENYFPFYAELEDRFGDNGLVSVVIGQRVEGRMVIVSWLMSCRVISRCLEWFVLERLVEIAHGNKLTAIRGQYIPTPKNSLVANHYETLGFRLLERLGDGSATWELNVAAHVQHAYPIERKLQL